MLSNAPVRLQNKSGTSGTGGNIPQRYLIGIAVGLAVILHVGSARWNILYGAQNADEGFYAVATRAVAQGEMPYRDFGFSQPPVILYANSLLLRLTGFGLFAQRTVNGFWTALALILAANWLTHRTLPIWGLVLAVGFSITAPWMYFNHLGKTYGLTTFLVMLGAWAYVALRTGPRRNFVIGIIAALGVGTRLPTAPFFGHLWILALLPGRRSTVREIGAACGGLIIFAVFLPFWFAAPAQLKFWIIDLHRLSLPYRDWQVGWSEIVALAPAVWLLTAIALGIIAFRRRLLTRECGLLLAAVTTLAMNVLPGGAYAEYGVPFLLPMAAGAAALVYDEFKTKNRGPIYLIVIFLIATQLVTAPLLSRRPLPDASIASRWLSPNAPPYNRSLPTQIATARSIVEKFLAPDAPFIGSNIILAAETGRTVPPELRMGPFSFTLEIPPDEASRLHLTTHEQLDQWFARPDVTLIAFFRRRELNYGWTMPTFGQLREEVHSQWFAPLRRDFEMVYETDNDFLILVRKPTTNPP